jgi:transcriptional regulator with XRE-family HTH domain
MSLIRFPVIDAEATGANILRLRKSHGYSVRDLQQFFGFEEPQAIYKWQRGQSLPSVDNLYALSELLEVPMNEILVPSRPMKHITSCERQAEACRSPLFEAHSGLRRYALPDAPILLEMEQLVIQLLVECLLRACPILAVSA